MSSYSLFTVPPEQGFVDALAAGLLAEIDTDRNPDGLADVTILLPTRRACLSLREAFLRASGGRALILPRMRPIGDVDEEEMVLTGPADIDLLSLPPAIGSTERLMLLTRLVLKKVEAEGGSPDQAVHLARELARLLDQVETEEVSFDGLEKLVAEEHAEHWARTLEFLEIVSKAWPAHLVETSEIGAAERRARLLRAQADLWRAAPPEGQVIAAGSTGSIPATAALLGVVAALPNGRVVLPGLDRDLDDDAWDLVRSDPAHPQHGLAALLDRLGATRSDVLEWQSGKGMEGVSEALRQRTKLISAAMRPAKASGAWHRLDAAHPKAFQGVDWLEAEDDVAEARTIALTLREVLEAPGRTAALVTPDRTLARRVAAELARWDIAIDDSAGTPLSETPPAVFLRLLAEAAASDMAPVPLLSMLKHPMANLGLSPGVARAEARNLERTLLRGPKPSGGLDGLRHVLAGKSADLTRDPPSDQRERLREALIAAGQFIDLLEGMLRPFLALFQTSEAIDLAQLLDSHLAAAEQLVRTREEDGATRLWSGEAGEMLGEMLSELRLVLAKTGQASPDIRAGDYPGFLDAFLGDGTVRPRYGRHPRLAILGPLEARLQRADLLILAGLNEGVWPSQTLTDAWMSRPMRAEFGLPPPERRIGLSAHDFCQALSAPRVLLTRAVKSGGEPTVPSRWLERLSVVARRVDLAGLLPNRNARAATLAGWQSELEDHPRLPTMRPPEPKPPVSARPKTLSVTRIETWRRDPYSIFAHAILRLRPLEDLEADLTAADKGSIIHDILDRFVRECPGVAGDAAFQQLAAIGRDVFGEDRLAYPSVRAFWWPRFERIARWFLDQEADRRDQIQHTHTEIDGRLAFQRADGADFVLTARADRIDEVSSGGYSILDYKTGDPPRGSDVEAGYAPQLPLEAAIANAGGFDGLPAGQVTELAFWKLSGGAEAGRVQTVDPSLAMDALGGLARLVAAFDDPTMPYHPIPRRDRAPRFNDYEHLARIREWMVQDRDGS